jgi:hypothetical protein
MKRLIISGIFVSMAVLLIGTASTNAQRINESPQGGYDLSWYTINGGGATFSTGGSYSLGGTIGQPEAVGQVGNSPYTLVDGFWGGVSIANYALYLPLVRR